MKSQIMNPHKISAYSDNKQKSCGMLVIELVTWGVTNRDVLLLATIRYVHLRDSWSDQKVGPHHCWFVSTYAIVLKIL